MKIAKLMIPALGTGLALAAEVEIDAVAEGKKIFESVGCSECHTVEKGDVSLKTGPNLYGLFLKDVRDRKVVAGGKETVVKADKAYFESSLRKSPEILAIAESGPTEGTAYLPLMPSYVEEMVSSEGAESLWHYMRTLADGGQAGPANVMVKREAEVQATNILEIPGEEIVTDRIRVLRAPLQGTSGRAIHVGQPNGMSYTFDPRMLSVRRVWTGGFVNLKEERTNRGNGLSTMGVGAAPYIQGTALLNPVTSSGGSVDFEFKEPDAHDYVAIEKHLWDGKDFSEKLAEIDAEFLGYRIIPGTGQPAFRFRIGKNVFTETVAIREDGKIEITLEGDVETAQEFRVAAEGLSEVSVSAGNLAEGIWSLPAAASGPFILKGSLAGGSGSRMQTDRKENLKPQVLVTRPAEPARKPLELPAGYSLEDWLPPLDLLGKEQLFEPTGIAVAKNGTIVIATRAAGVWRLRDKKWTQFAESTYEALGVVIEDEKGDVIVVAQKPELTRITDSDGDGRADWFDTVSDDYGFHANYHEYTHGPVRDGKGNYYFLLNLSHAQNELKASWKAGGKFMGSMGGYRGWAMRVTPEGKTETYAHGLRSPAGLGVAPDGRIWYSENQGEYVGSSKIVPLEKGEFYGHISGLVDLPGMVPDAKELAYDLWKDKLRRGAVWLPHGKLANSPGSPTWDQTGGAFGPYGDQMFIGDQTLSQLMRVSTEIVDGKDQGGVVPFSRGLASGVMRPVFLPDGSLLLGQTGRGWVARGGSQSALQRVIYDGKTVPSDISSVSASGSGFTVSLTSPIADSVSDADLSKAFEISSWFYTNLPEYGSPEHEKRDEGISRIKLSEDRMKVYVTIQDFGEGDKWLDRIYHIKIANVPAVFGDPSAWKLLEGFYTLRAIPKGD